MRDANYKVTNHVCFFNFKTFLFHAKYPEIPGISKDCQKNFSNFGR